MVSIGLVVRGPPVMPSSPSPSQSIRVRPHQQYAALHRSCRRPLLWPEYSSPMSITHHLSSITHPSCPSSPLPPARHFPQLVISRDTTYLSVCSVEYIALHFTVHPHLATHPHPVLAPLSSHHPPATSTSTQLNQTGYNPAPHGYPFTPLPRYLPPSSQSRPSEQTTNKTTTTTTTQNKHQ